MKNPRFILVLLLITICTLTGAAQNVGIGTTDPQRKLHVAGDVRIDAFVNTGNGLIVTNSIGDLSRMSFSNNAADVLKGNGTWGAATGVVPTTGIVGTTIYNNPDLINAGYSLFGELPNISSYSTTASTFPADTWQPIYTRGIVTNVSAPEFSFNTGEPPLAVSNGVVMYVPTSNQVFTYNPVTDIWNIISNTGFSNFTGNKCVWTGTEIIFWAGQFVTGKRYNPATDVWTDMAVTNAPSSRYDYTMIWDGTRVILWGGTSGGIAVNTGAMYNPTTNTWVTMNVSGAAAARTLHTAIWDNVSGRMIVWGGGTSPFSGEMNTGGLFSPSTNTWTGLTNTAGAPVARIRHTAIWTGTEMIIFGGDIAGTPQNIPLSSGGKYNPSTNVWAATTSAPVTLSRHAAIWTGSAMFVSGGRGPANSSVNSAYSYNPGTNLWTSAGQFGTDDEKEHHNSFLTGNIILVWGGKNVENSSLLFNPNWTNTGYRYFLSATASSVTLLTKGTLYLYRKN